MPPQTLVKRIESLETRMTVLEQLPARVGALESQISKLREEMHAEFSAVRSDIRAGDEETRRTLREEIRAGDEETRRTLREEIRAGDEETRRALREEIRAGDEETRRALREEMRDQTSTLRREARVYHEDLVGRLKLLYEGHDPSATPPPPVDAS